MNKLINTLRNSMQVYAKTRHVAFKTIEIEDQSTHIIIDMKGPEEAIELHDKYTLNEAFRIDHFIEWVEEHGCKVVAAPMNDKELSILHANTINQYAKQCYCKLDEDAYTAWFIVHAPLEEVLERFGEEQLLEVLKEIDAAKEEFL